LPAGNYILVIDGNAGSQCSWTFRDRINGTVLPVRWIGFEGKLTEDKRAIQLTWQTGEEEQNQGFEVQRSLDGLNFNKISFVESNYSGNYEFIDNEYPTAPVVYYRLRQLDYNHEYTFSDVVAVTTHADNTGLSTVHEVYPNPAQNQITVPFVTAKDDIINVMIYDMSGRLVLYPVNDRNYTTGQHFIQIELPADMPRGLYTLRFESQQGSQVKRFLLE
jgi:Secretion system C-terminal sorting domain